MARKALEPTAIKGITTEQQGSALHSTAAALLNQNSEEIALVNQLLGQAQMADSFAKFSKTVLTSKLAYVKEHKLYRALQGQKSEDGLGFSGTWQEFCNLLGFTPEHANESIANLNNFGEEALESMSRMGIGYREMRQFRKLPDDSKQALIEVAKAGDKESFVELAEEIISKHTKEKEQLTQERDEAQANYEALGDSSKRKDDKINELDIELTKLKTQIEKQTPDQAAKALIKEVGDIGELIHATANTSLRSGLKLLSEHDAAHNSDHRVMMAGWVAQIEVLLNELRSTFDLPRHLDGDNTPDWMRDDAEAQVVAALAQAKEA